MNCPNCQHSVPDRAKFCPECGSPLSIHCSECGAKNSNNAKFCVECGVPLQRTAAPATSISSGSGNTGEAPAGRASLQTSEEHVASTHPSPIREQSIGERRQLTVM